jgi:uncharacterized delta-60 repeat protein
MKRFVCFGFVAGFFVLFLNPAAMGANPAPGQVDTSFAGTGRTRTGFGFGQDIGRAVLLQPDGKMVIAGYSGDNGGNFSAARLDTNHVLDVTFGDAGKVITPMAADGRYAYARAAGLQQDGKIVLAGNIFNGSNYNFFAVARYNTNGTLDSSFGTTGKVFTDFGQSVSGSAMAIQADGKILVAGSYFANGRGDFALARYNTNGSLDTTFGGTGTIITDAGGGAAAYSLTLQAGGLITAAGQGGADSGHFEFAIVRYTTNGTLDGTFGTGGKVFTQIGSSAQANASGIQLGNNTVQNPDKLVVAGQSSTAGFVVARYNLNGTLDTNFNGSGIVSTPIASADFATSLFTQGSGIQPRKITVGGYSKVGANFQFSAARYTTTGALDTTFGGGTGKVLLPIGGAVDDEAYEILYAAGQIVMAGVTGENTDNSDFAVARLNSDGSPDVTFGTNGIVTIDVLDRSSSANAVAIQSDQKIVVAGSADNGLNEVFALARYNPDGSLDNSFGSSGKVTTDVSTGSAVAKAVQIQTDGKIVAAGYSGTNRHFAVVRYNPNGTLDTAFGGTGKVTTDIGSTDDEVNSLQIQSDGKIVAAGLNQSGGYNDYALARFNTNGTFDLTFGNNGKVVTSLSTNTDQIQALQIQPDGKLVAVGVSVGSSPDFALVRYNSNGARDFSFGTLGIVTTDIAGGSVDYPLAGAIQPDGKILAAGFTISSGNAFIALTRYATNGALDGSFGTGGKVITQIGAVNDYASCLAVQSNGKIVAGGATQVGTNDLLAILRYNSDGSLDNSYGTGGITVANFGEDEQDFGRALALDQLGRAVIAGGANDKFGVIRFTGDPVLKFLSISLLTNGHVLLQGLGFPSRVHTISTSGNLTLGSFGFLDSVTPDASGFWEYEDSSAVGINSRFYRLSFP